MSISQGAERALTEIPSHLNQLVKTLETTNKILAIMTGMLGTAVVVYTTHVGGTITMDPKMEAFIKGLVEKEL